MIRGLFTLCLLAGFVYFGLTVKLGSRTLFGHAANIWQAEETQEMVEGVKEKGAPVVEKVARGARAGWDEVTNGDSKSAPDSSAPRPANKPPAGTPSPASGADGPESDAAGQGTPTPATDAPSPSHAPKSMAPGSTRTHAGAPS